MQDLPYTDSFSPSFSFYASGGGNLIEAAVRAVHDSKSYYSVKVNDDDEEAAEFEFETSPLHEESFFHFPTKTLDRLPDEEGDDYVETDRVITSKNLFYDGWNIDPSLSSPSQSHSSSDSDGLEDLSPSKYYCFWSPIRSPARGDSSKSKDSSASKQCLIKKLLRRSHSDGAVSTTSEPKRCRFKELLRRSHSHSHSDGGVGGSSISPSRNGSPVVKVKSKPASYKPTNIGEIVMRRKTYLPYRQDLIGVFAGISRSRR